MRTDPARVAALRLLSDALTRRGGFESGLQALAKLSSQDRAFARALVMATLRRLGPIDRMLDARLAREPPASVRNLLRLGLAQVFWLDTPDFAAVDTTVDLAPKSFRGLVNAVLRGQLRDGPPADDPETFAPSWLYARWKAMWGAASARSIAEMIAAEPPTDLSAKGSPEPELSQSLEAEILPGGTLRVHRRGDITAWPGYDAGAWWVQDAAAAIPARLLGAAPGECVLDLCAAPGGKTFQLAATGARVTAIDRSASRLGRVREGLTRLGQDAETIAADAGGWVDPRLFDCVLLDAPCSATGTFRRHPDVLWNARPGDIASLAAAQARLLTSAACRVKPGGRLVYAVCSLEREEGEDQASELLAANPDFSIETIAPEEGGAPACSATPEGWLRILPHHIDGGLDGFFVARFRRSS
jgi:16S rRNA (cytosine967-C5)-methyltransferase